MERDAPVNPKNVFRLSIKF